MHFGGGSVFNMMSILRKNLTFLLANYAPYHRVSCSLSLRLFSTSKEEVLATSPAIFDLLRNKYQFSPEAASKVSSVLNRVKDPQKSDSILSFLKQSGFSNAQLEKMTKSCPRVLSVSLEDRVKPKIRVYQDLGFSSDDISEIISKEPSTFNRNLKISNARVITCFSMLKGLLRTNDAVAKIWRRCGWFLAADLERTMVPNIEFLKRCGIPMERILRLLCSYPRYLLLKPVTIRKSVEKAEEMGANRNSNMFIYAIRVLSTSDKNWELKIQGLRNCGFSESDLRTMFEKAPQIFGQSIEKLKRTKDVIVATGKYDISSILNNPMSLSFNVEKRLKPRIQILEILESKNLMKNWPSLGSLAVMSDKMFFKKFVGPYLSVVGKAYAIKSSAWANIENNL